MKYFGYMPNDFINGKNISVSLWTAGCPHQCPGCHNAHMWDYDNGYEVPTNLKEQIFNAITANNMMRNFSVLGGEPLSAANRDFVLNIISAVRNKFPNITIYLWTGYTIEEIHNMHDKDINNILQYVDVLIEGRYKQAERDISLALRGSRNQRILYKGEF